MNYLNNFVGQDSKVEQAFFTVSPIYRRFTFTDVSGHISCEYSLFVYDNKTEHLVEDLRIPYTDIVREQGSVERLLSRRLYSLRLELDHYLLCEELMLNKRSQIVWC